MGEHFLRFVAANWADDLRDGIKPVLIGLFAVVGVLVVGYAIFLGFLLAKAKDQGERQIAKRRMFSTLSGLFIIVVLTGAFIGWDLDGFTANPPVVTQPSVPVVPGAPPPEVSGGGGSVEVVIVEPENPPDFDELFSRSSLIEGSYYEFAYPIRVPGGGQFDVQELVGSSVRKTFDGNSVWLMPTARVGYIVHSVENGTVISVGIDDPVYGNYYVVRHDETIHTHNVLERTVTMISPCQGSFGSNPPVNTFAREYNTGWELAGTTNNHSHGNPPVACWDNVWAQNIGREVYQYVFSMYANLDDKYFNENRLEIGAEVAAGRWLGVIYIDNDAFYNISYENSSLHFEMIIKGEDRILQGGSWVEAPKPVVVPSDGHVNPLDYFGSNKVFPVSIYPHWNGPRGPSG